MRNKKAKQLRCEAAFVNVNYEKTLYITEVVKTIQHPKLEGVNEDGTPKISMTEEHRCTVKMNECTRKVYKGLKKGYKRG